MEMHTRESLYAIHGIDVSARRPSRPDAPHFTSQLTGFRRRVAHIIKCACGLAKPGLNSLGQVTTQRDSLQARASGSEPDANVTQPR